MIRYHCLSQSSLSVQLEYKLPSLLSQQSVKLIVIDSLAALFRVEFTVGQAAQRAQLLRAFGAQLRRLSDEYGAAVVCVNQVSSPLELHIICIVENFHWAENFAQH